MPFDVRVGGNDLERGGDLVLRGPAADVEEVRRALAIELDDVHGRHGEAGAIDHAADRAFERDIVEIVLGGLDLLGVLLAFVAQGDNIGMAVEGVVVEGNLGVEHAQLAVRHDDQRIDLQHRHVLGDESRIELRDQALDLLGQIAGESERARRGAAVVGHDSSRRIDREAVNLFRRVMGDVLDVDAALGREDERNPARLPVDQRREIELLVDIRAVLDIEAVDLLAGGAGLHGHEGRAQHLPGERAHLFNRAREPHAALFARGRLLESPFAAAAGVNLAFDHPQRPAELPGAVDRFVGREGRIPAGERNAERAQHRFGLIFMNVHATTTRKEANARRFAGVSNTISRRARD